MYSAYGEERFGDVGGVRRSDLGISVPQFFVSSSF